jgi:hypothetical protein
MDIKPMEVMPQSLSYMKKVAASSNPNPHWNDVSSVNNGDWVGSYWQPAESDSEPWAEIDLGESQKISSAVIYESGRNVKAFELQYKSGEEWKTLHKGSQIGSRAEIKFKPTDARFVRLVIKSFSATPGIYELILLKK